MGTQTQTEPAILESQAPRWSLAARVGFRFAFVYILLFCLTTQIIGGFFPIPGFDFPDPASLPPIQRTVAFAATHIFGVKHQLVFTGSGSGDKTSDWVMVFCILVISALAAALWSVLDRRRLNYVAMGKWLRLFVRFALATEMLLYGIDKAVPLQMPFPFLTRLLEPFGNFSPMGVLWSSIGASRGYEIFAGSAEMLGGILLFFPRTTLLGALVCLADMIQVFMLNMTYDVPVKLFSFHLVLFALFLIGPDLRRLYNFFLLHREAAPASQPALFRSPRANRIAVAAQAVFGLMLLGLYAYNSATAWYTYGGGRPQSPLFGIWDIESPAPEANWRRLIFDFPTVMAVQQTDDAFTYIASKVDTASGTLTLTTRGKKEPKAVLHYQRVAPGQLTLDGPMDGHPVHIQLKLLDHTKFMLVSRGFHWIQEYPYNR